MIAYLRFIKKYIACSKEEVIFLVIILLIASFLRLWRIDEYLPFLGDEGRDVRVVRRFLVDFDLMFVGPRTSVGDMYLGPLYYYFMSPWLLLFRFSPVGPAVGVAFLNVLTVFFLWLVGRTWFGKQAGLSAALLFATAPIVIRLGQHSWNPNIMPFFALLAIYSIWKVWQNGSFLWLIVLGIAFAFVLQSHYLGLLLVPTVGIIWFLSLWKLRDKKKFLLYSFWGLIVFLFLMSPLFIFDAKYGWRNTEAILRFFTHRQTTISAKPWNALPNIWPIWQTNVVTELLAAGNSQIGFWISLLLPLFAFWILWSCWKRKKQLPAPADFSCSFFLLVVVWIVVGIWGLALYKHAIFTHYLEFFSPGVFLLTGATLAFLWFRKRILAILILLGMVVLNFVYTPLQYPPNKQLARTIRIDKKILQEAEGKPFNFALIAKNNYEEGYLYFFELWNAPLLLINPQEYSKTRTNQLFVVCEDLPCNPINHPKAEIANFGWAKIAGEWSIDGLKLFKLVPKEDKDNENI